MGAGRTTFLFTWVIITTLVFDVHGRLAPLGSHWQQPEDAA